MYFEVNSFEMSLLNLSDKWYLHNLIFILFDLNDPNGPLNEPALGQSFAKTVNLKVHAFDSYF